MMSLPFLVEAEHASLIALRSFLYVVLLLLVRVDPGVGDVQNYPTGTSLCRQESARMWQGYSSENRTRSGRGNKKPAQKQAFRERAKG